MLVDAAPAGGEAERADGVFAKPRIDFLCAMTSLAMFRILGSNRGVAAVAQLIKTSCRAVLVAAAPGRST